MGLLQLCEEYLRRIREGNIADNEDGILFEQLCSKYQFPHAGYLKMVSGVYVMQHCFGLNALTVCHSISTKTFWKGTLPSPNTWYVFKAGDIAEYYQLFDREIIHNIKSFAVIRLANVKEESIFFVYSEEEEITPPQDITMFSDDLFHLCNVKQKTAIDCSKIEGVGHTFVVVAMADAIENSLGDLDNADESIKLCLRQSIFEEIYRIMTIGFGEHNIVNFDDDKEIKVAISVPQEVNSKLLLVHLQNVCQKIIGKFAVQFMSCLDAGTCKNAKGLKGFIL